MYEEELERIGLTSGESRAYVSLLSLGSSSIGAISLKSKVAASKISGILQRLIEKGLVSMSIKEKTRYYQAISPERLGDLIEKREMQISEDKAIYARILPSLKSLNSVDQYNQESEIFIGKKALISAYELMVNESSNGSTLKYLYVHSSEYDTKTNDYYFGIGGVTSKKINPLLKTKKIKWLGLVDDTDREFDFSKKLPASIIQKKASFPLPGNIDISPEMVLITSWEEDKPVGILIKSKQIASNFNKYFDKLWNISKK